jgi:hypothetical protein
MSRPAVGKTLDSATPEEEARFARSPDLNGESRCLLTLEAFFAEIEKRYLLEHRA